MQHWEWCLAQVLKISFTLSLWQNQQHHDYIFLACSTKTCMYKYSRLYFHFCKINFYRQIKGKKFKDFHISLKLLTACCLLNWFHVHRWHNRSRLWIYKRGTLLESFPHLSKRTGSGTFHTWNTIVDYVIILILKLTKLIKKTENETASLIFI